MENFPVKIVRQTLPRISCDKKVCGRVCRGQKKESKALFGAMDSLIYFWKTIS